VAKSKKSSDKDKEFSSNKAKTMGSELFKKFKKQKKVKKGK
jgi:hypothetical protein